MLVQANSRPKKIIEGDYFSFVKSLNDDGFGKLFVDVVSGVFNRHD